MVQTFRQTLAEALSFAAGVCAIWIVAMTSLVVIVQRIFCG